MGRLVVLAAILLTLLTLGGGAVLFYGFDRFERDGPLTADTIVYIPRGTGFDGITRRLHEAGVIDDPTIFQLGVRALGAARGLRAGEYRFPARGSMRDAVQVLSSGETVVHRLTLPEGLMSAEVVALIAGSGALEGEAGPVPPEGALLPETYHFSRGDGRADLIARMARDMDKVLAELWLTRAEGLPLDSPEQAVILASIVEKETALPAERPLVASVYLNRLGKGLRLQSDPTVAYGLSGGAVPLDRPLTHEDLRAPGPYNTYLNPGLPPGPIANPGRASLEAVLHPAETDYLYFVADGSGGHAFAKTLRGHNRNVKQWRKVKKQQSQEN
jgi:UPF0755 protein